MKTPSRENNWLVGLDRWLEKQPFTWCVNLHGSAFQLSGLPDRLILMRGVLFAVEAKQEGKAPSTLQAWTLSRIEKAGGVVVYRATSKEIVAGAIMLALEARGLLTPEERT